MKRIVPSNQFKKDLKRSLRQGKDQSKLAVVIDVLAEGKSLEIRYHPHKLKGVYARYWECHIEPDWLLIYETDVTEVLLVRLGTHSELFE